MKLKAYQALELEVDKQEIAVGNAIKKAEESILKLEILKNK